jgi:DNA polymerase-1
MERRGARIDREYTQARSDEFLQYVKDVERWCVDTYGVKPGANADVVARLQEFGYTFDKRTASGAYALDKEVLGPIDHPLAQAVFSRRRVQKLQSTYLRRFLEFSEYDGLLHPHINSIGGTHKKASASEGEYGVRTGRMSMDSPNLQNLPRRSESNPFAEVVRNCVIARDGHTLLFSDFDQIEMRVFAHLSQDQGMINAFLNAVGRLDFFTIMARQVYGDDTLEKKDPRRQTAKNAGYAKAYGAGPEKFALTAGIPPAEGYAFLDVFDRLYPGVQRFQREVDERATERRLREGDAYVLSPLTRRRHVADPGREYALVNYLIQGMAGEILKMKLLELDAAGLGEYMILPVHDEVIFDVPDPEVPDAIRTIHQVMNDANLLSVPITAGTAHGQRWGEKKDVTLEMMTG